MGEHGRYVMCVRPEIGAPSDWIWAVVWPREQGRNSRLAPAENGDAAGRQGKAGAGSSGRTAAGRDEVGTGKRANRGVGGRWQVA